MNCLLLSHQVLAPKVPRRCICKLQISPSPEADGPSRGSVRVCIKSFGVECMASCCLCAEPIIGNASTYNQHTHTHTDTDTHSHTLTLTLLRWQRLHSLEYAELTVTRGRDRRLTGVLCACWRAYRMQNCDKPTWRPPCNSADT